MGLDKFDSGVQPDARSPAIQGCEGLPAEPVEVVRLPDGNWTLALPKKARWQQIKVLGEQGMAAAVAVDWANKWTKDLDDVSGFIISREAIDREPYYEARRVIRHIKDGVGDGIFTDATLIHPGWLTTSHDGYPMVTDIALELKTRIQTKPAWIRNNIFPLLLGGDQSDYENMPSPEQGTSQIFTVRLSVLLRAENQQVIATGGIARQLDYTNALIPRVRVRVSQMADGTAVGEWKAVPEVHCEHFDLNKPVPVDILWLIDESDYTVTNGGATQSMGTLRNELVTGLNPLWVVAELAGIDLRMAVMGMGRVGMDPKAETAGTAVDLCHPEVGANGQFWTQDQQLDFQSCVNGPLANLKNKNITGSYGLTNMVERLPTLLPRRADNPRRLRTGAQLVVVFVSLKMATSIFDWFTKAELQVPKPGSEYTRTEKQIMDGLIKASVDMLQGRKNKDTLKYFKNGATPAELKGTLAYALVLDPRLGCGMDQRGTGYIDLVENVSGGLDAACLDDDGLTYMSEQWMREIAARALGARLRYPPISSSLTLAFKGESTVRSRSYKAGYDLHVPTGGLLFYCKSDDSPEKEEEEVDPQGCGGKVPQPGDSISVSYRGWN
jgi:hypothetical protein